MSKSGQWHGKKVYFGLHYDLHATNEDTNLGARCDPEELISLLRIVKPQWVQTDSKGHPGLTSWYSETPTATVCSGLKKDVVRCWREATRELGVPLHCHYSGIWDVAATQKYPDWAVTPAPQDADKSLAADRILGQRMCPRSPYVDELMIPQMLELIDRYGIDGFWVDAEIWGIVPCYCDRCCTAFTEQTGLTEPPTDTSDPHWVDWINFHRRSFYEYVTRYCDAVHQHKPGVLVCANWLQTIHDPGEPTVPTDWISADHTSGLDGLRCEARFISTRGKPWDMMPWNFLPLGGMDMTTNAEDMWEPKPVQMLQQEAAMILPLGGNFQMCGYPKELRDGRVVPWRMERLQKVGKFVKARRSLCQDTETIPQVVVLHSEFHFHAQPACNLYHDYDVTPVEGAVLSLLENSYGVDLMDEWALLPRLGEFPLVVTPEQDNMSEAAVDVLRHYVREGGRLLVTGAAAYDRFGADFLGVTSQRLEADATYHIPAGDGSFILHSKSWRLLEPATAQGIGTLGRTSLLDEQLLPYPAATLNRVGRGRVAYIPCDLFSFLRTNRYPLARCFVGEIVSALRPRLAISVKAPRCVDVILRQKAGQKLVHLVNRSSGTPGSPMVEESPAVGPVQVQMELMAEPRRVRLALEKGELSWEYRPGKRAGKLVAVVPQLQIHCVLVVDE